MTYEWVVILILSIAWLAVSGWECAQAVAEYRQRQPEGEGSDDRR